MFCHPVRAIFSRCTIHLSTDPVVEKSLCYCILYKNFTHKTSNTEPVLYEIFDLTLRNHDYYRNTHSISIGSVLASKTSFRQPEPIGPFRGGGRTNRIGSDRIDDRVDVDSVRGSDGSFRTVRWMPEPVGSPEPRVGADPVLSLSLSLRDGSRISVLAVEGSWWFRRWPVFSVAAAAAAAAVVVVVELVRAGRSAGSVRYGCVRHRHRRFVVGGRVRVDVVNPLLQLPLHHAGDDDEDGKGGNSSPSSSISSSSAAAVVPVRPPGGGRYVIRGASGDGDDGNFSARVGSGGGGGGPSPFRHRRCRRPIFFRYVFGTLFFFGDNRRRGPPPTQPRDRLMSSS